MAPKVPNINENANESNSLTTDLSKRPQRHRDTQPQHSTGTENPGDVSLLRQVALCAGLLASDGGLVFMQLTMLPTLQTLGVPVTSVTIPGCLSGTMALVGLPLLGCFSDRGKNPRGRKKPAVLFSALVFLAGFSFVISGCAVHTWSGNGMAEEAKTNGVTLSPSFTQMSPVDRFEASIRITNPSVTDSSSAHLWAAPSVQTEFPQGFADHATGDEFSYETLSGEASPQVSEAGPSGVNPSHAGFSYQPEEGKRKSSSSENWMDDPLGLAIPLAGLLGILGFAFIDMGNDLNNSSQKSFVLASTAPHQHVSLLVVGVQLSALGGCVAAILGVTDLAALLIQGTVLETVPGKTLLQSGIFIVLTLLCVLITILAVPSSSSSSVQLDKAQDAEAPSSDLIKPKYSSYGTLEIDTDSVKLQMQLPSEVITENTNCKLADSSLQLSSQHIDKTSNRFRYDSSCTMYTCMESSIMSEVHHLESSYESDDTVQLLSESTSQKPHGSSRLHALKHNHGTDSGSKKAKLFASDSIVFYAFKEDSNSQSEIDCESGGAYSTKPLPHLRHRQGEEELSASHWCGSLMNKQSRRLTLICISMFFMTGAWQSFNVCATDYLGKVVYGGDPDADADSQSYAAYQQGMRTGSSGVLVLNGIYVVVNFLQKKLLTAAGPKIECMVVSVLQIAALVAMLFTNNVISFYVTASVFGIFRSAMYTIPFMLANEICQEEAKSLTGKRQVNVGSTMALVTSMIPLSNILVSSMTGPLIYSTGDPTTPLYYTVGATIFAALVFIFT